MAEFDNSRPSKVATGRAILFVGIVALGIITFAWWILAIIFGFISPFEACQTIFKWVTAPDWEGWGNILRNTAGWAALIAAIATVTVALKTNTTRAKEAASADFRDQMQWAADHLGEDVTPYQFVYALMLVERYAKLSPTLLSDEDKELAVRLQALIEQSTDISEDTEQNEVSDENDEATSNSEPNTVN